MIRLNIIGVVFKFFEAMHCNTFISGSLHNVFGSHLSI